jgi:small subunit ribosomal protein S18
VYCTERLWVDYKDVNTLRRFQSDRGKIKARRVTGNCTQHHRDVAIAIKTARELALLPYLQRTVVERAGGRSLRVGGSGDRGARPGAPRPPSESGDGAGEAIEPPAAMDESGGGDDGASDTEAPEPAAVAPEPAP